MSRCMSGPWVAGLVVSLASSPASGAPQPPPENAPTIGTSVGQMAPDFLLPRLEGGSGRLSDYRGRKVLLVHFASW